MWGEVSVKPMSKVFSKTTCGLTNDIVHVITCDHYLAGAIENRNSTEREFMIQRSKHIVNEIADNLFARRCLSNNRLEWGIPIVLL